MRFFFKFFLFGVLIFSIGCETAPKTKAASNNDGAALAGAEPIDSPTATLVVHGMGCPLCANNVDKQLLAVPGVDRVNIDLGSGEVKVHLGESRPTRSQLARAITESGFTLVSIHTP